MVSRLTNKLKREFNTFFSRAFKHKISFSETIGPKTKLLESVDSYSFKNGKYVFKGKEPHWTCFNNIKLRPLFIKELKGAEVIGHGVVVNEDGEVELESAIFQKEYLNKLNCNHWIFFRRIFSKSKVKNAIVLSNYLERNYYHWILESVGRIALLENDVLKDYKIILNSNPPQFAIDSLCGLFDTKPSNILRNNKMRLEVNKLLLISFPITRDKTTSWTNVYNPSIISKINLLSKKKTTLSAVKENFIISRRNATQRRIISEDIIIEKYNRLNFNVVYLEDLTFKEQMQLFRNAGVIIATHGAGLVNLLFSENPFIVEFFPSNRNNRDAFYFYQISNSLGFNHNVIEFESFNKEMDLVVDDKVLNELDKIITERNTEYSKWAELEEI